MSGSACLPQSAPTVQAQVSSTATANVTKPQQTIDHNQEEELKSKEAIDVLVEETQCAPLACDSHREQQGTKAGSLVNPIECSLERSNSVITSLS